MTIHREVLKSILTEDPGILEQIILHDPKYNDRLLIQLACIDKFKYEESQRQGSDIGWAQATVLWVDRGYAKKYNEVFKEGENWKSIYRQTTC